MALIRMLLDCFTAYEYSMSHEHTILIASVDLVYSIAIVC